MSITWVVFYVIVAFCAGYAIRESLLQVQNNIDTIRDVQDSLEERVSGLIDTVEILSKNDIAIMSAIDSKIIQYVKPTCRRLTEQELAELLPREERAEPS